MWSTEGDIAGKPFLYSNARLYDRGMFRLWIVGIVCLITGAEALAWELAPRKAVGMLAVDRATGERIWEAWLPEDIPSQERGHAKYHLYDWWEEAQTGPPFQKPLFVDYKRKGDSVVVGLTADGAFRKAPIRSRSFAGIVYRPQAGRQYVNWKYYFLVVDGILYAMPKVEPKVPGWEPDWRLDLALPADSDSVQVFPDYETVWVVTRRNAIAVSMDGKLMHRHALDDTNSYKDRLVMTFSGRFAILTSSDKMRVFRRDTGGAVGQA